MVINFPPTDLSDPLGSHEHSQNGITWEWDGEKWRVSGRPADTDLPQGTYVGTFAEVDVDIPTAEREEGQLLWNTDDGILYIWYGPDPGNTKQWVITVPQGSGGGSGSIVVGDSAPSPAETGDLWFNSSSGPGGGTMYVYYDGNWVISVPQPSGPYLSSEKDDSAFGKISFYDGLNVNSGDATFRTPTTHEAGITVTGGTTTGGDTFGIYTGAGAPNYFANSIYIGGSTSSLGDNTSINLRETGQIEAERLNLLYSADFSQVEDTSKVAWVQQSVVTNAGTGIGFKSVNGPSEASVPFTNCPRIFFNRCQDPSGLQINSVEERRVVTDNLAPALDNSTIGELNFSTSDGPTDIYIGRLTTFKRSDGGEVEISVHNTTGDEDYGYYFDPNGKFGYRHNNFTEFYMQVSDANDLFLLETEKGRLRFRSQNGMYSYFSPDYGSDLHIQADDDFLGLTTGAKNSVFGKYGIKNTNNSTVSLVNSNGEIRLTPAGNSQFFRGSDYVIIYPGGTDVSGTVRGTAELLVSKSKTTTRISNETVLELQGDDPAAYQTTYSTDEDGNQVEEQEYIGETETLLEIIRDLRARVAALEGN